MMRRIQLMALSFRGDVWLLVLPLAVILVLVPVDIITSVVRVGPYEALPGAVNTLQEYIPVCVLCWQIVLLREHLETGGNEVLLAYQPESRTRVLELLTGVAVYSAIAWGVVYLLAYALEFEGMEIMPLRLMIQTLFFSALFYCSAGIAGNIGVGLIVVLTYYFLVGYCDTFYDFSLISVFQPVDNMRVPGFGVIDLVTAAVSAMFLCVGHWAIKQEK